MFGAGGQAVRFPGRSDADLGSPWACRYLPSPSFSRSITLLAAVDAIKARSKTPPVIVIQSDEEFEEATSSARPPIRTSGSRACSPCRCRTRAAHPPAPPTTVNTLRYVFDRVFRTGYPMLRAASFPELDFPYQYEAMRVR